MTQVIAGLILLSVLVIVHEFGHFIVAKAMGVKVLAFSVGFGPRLFGFKRGDTEYQFCLIPLGGYVRMFGETAYDEELPEAEKRYSFLHQPYWKKFAIASAGPIFNFAFPVILFFCILVGNETVMQPVVGTVTPGQAADVAGLLPKDRIVEIDGKLITTFSDVVERVSVSPQKPLVFGIERPQANNRSQHLSITITPTVDANPHPLYPDKKTGRIGVMSVLEKPQIAVIQAGSGGAAAGVQNLDTVVAVDGQPISSIANVFKTLAAKTGKAVHLTVARGAEKKRQEIVLPPVGPLPMPIAQSMRRFAVTLDELESHDYQKRLEETRAALVAANQKLAQDRGLAFIGNVVSQVTQDSAAAELGIKPGDRIVAVDGRPVRGVLEMQEAVSDATAEFHLVAVQSAHGTWMGAFRSKSMQDLFGLSFYDSYEPVPTFTRYVGPLDASRRAFQKTGELISATARSLWMLFRFEVPMSQLGGPIMIFGVAGQAAQQGFALFLYVMAVLSVSLGLMNLLPIPVLDGGHLLLFTIEAIQRKPLTMGTRALATKIGLAVILALMGLAIFNDVSRLMIGG